MHLMVVLEDRISDWVAKGEILDGYFNPGAAFDTVTILSLLDDAPDHGAIARLCAPARGAFLTAGLRRSRIAAGSFGLRADKLASRLKRLAPLVSGVAPDVMRAYGDGLAAIACAAISDTTNVPFAISLHTTPDPAIQSRYLPIRDRLWRRLMRRASNHALRRAGSVMAVYSPILDFLPADVAARTEIVPNVVGIDAPPQFPDPVPGTFRAVWVSRQIPGRDPRPIVAALAQVPEARLTLIGDGPLHAETRRIAAKAGVAGRTEFIRSMDNRALCRSLQNFDAMVVNSSFREMPKSVIEAGLTGLPVIANRSPAAEVKEYDDLPVIFVDGDTSSYALGMQQLIRDPGNCRVAAQRMAEIAWTRWNPEVTAAKAAQTLTALTH